MITPNSYNVEPTLPKDTASQKNSLSVCFLVTTEFTIDNRVKREALTLADAGHSVDVFCISGSSSRLPISHPKITIHRLTRSELPKWRSGSLKHWYWLAQVLLQGKKYNVIHCHDANTLWVGAILAQWQNAKLIYDAHEYWASVYSYREKLYKKTFVEKIDALKNTFNTNNLAFPLNIFNYSNLILGKHLLIPTKKYFYTRFLNRRIAQLKSMYSEEIRLMKRCDAVISVNQAILDRMQENTGSPFRRYLALRNTPMSYTQPSGSPDLAQGKPRLFHQTFHLPESTIVFLYQGVIAEIRGFTPLLEAFARLDQTDTALVFMGPISDHQIEPNFKKFKRKYPQHANRVFFKEAVYGDEFLNWTASADLGLAPIQNVRESYYYCLPNKVFEYLQAGLPIGASNFPELSSLINAYQIGFTFTPDDPNDICRTLKEFLCSPNPIERYTEGLRKAQLDLCWEKEQFKLLSLYKSL